MILELMPHHEDASLPVGHIDELLGLPIVEGQRLLDEDVLAGGQGGLGNLIVGLRRSGHHHAVDLGSPGRIRDTGGQGNVRERSPYGFTPLRIRFAHQPQNAEFVEIGNKILAPGPGADNSEVGPTLLRESLSKGILSSLRNGVASTFLPVFNREISRT